ncbi:MAG: hypothetical protein RJA44_880, partial [Pseudomonadota bacterium]
WRQPPSWAEAGRQPLSPPELALVHAEVEYREWLRRLAALVSDEGEGVEPPDPQLSRFSLWLRGEGRQQCAGMAEFEALRSGHEQLCRLLVRLRQEHAEGQAEAVQHHWEQFRHELAQMQLRLQALSERLTDQIDSARMPISSAFASF